MPAVVTITDPLGGVWPLDGSKGITVAPGRKGFQMTSYQHYRDESPALDGSFWRGSRALNRDLFIPIVISGLDRTTAKNTQRAITRAVSPRNGLCTITVAQPDGTVRSIQARYADGIEAGDIGPGAWGVVNFKYGLHFVAERPFFNGPQSVTSWSVVPSTRPELPIPGSDTLFEVVTSPILTSSIPIVTLNANPGFESGTVNWTAGGGSLGVDNVIFHSGAQSVSLIPDTVSLAATITSDQVAVIAGQVYAAQGWLRCATARTVQLNVSWYDSGHGFLSTSTGSLSITANTWTYISSTFVAPVGAAFASIIPTVPGTPPASDQLWADDIVFGQAGGVTLTVPGDVSTWPTWQFIGPFTSVTAQNVTTNKSFTISHTAASNANVLSLTTEPGSSSMVDEMGANRWDKFVSGYQLWSLAPGPNMVTLTVQGGTTSSLVNLSYSPRYEGD